jgi:uncharacterized membrane protein YtjA (UPF0391 family)
MGLLGWAFTFLIVAAIAGLFGFTGIAGSAMAVARVLFGLFLFVFLLLLVLALLGVGAARVIAP